MDKKTFSTNEPEYPVVRLFPMNNLRPQNELFIGRADALMNIQEMLKNNSVALITGQGGFGKTQTVVEYAYRHALDYHCIWYFNAESEARLRGDYREFAEKIGLTTESVSDFRFVCLCIADWFKSNKCLFIYDNAEGCPNLHEYLPHLNSHMIINSREHLQGITDKELNMTVFSLDDAKAFVLKRITPVSDGDAEILSQSLGCLPLALEQAVSFMKESDYTCEQYLGLLSHYGLCSPDNLSINTDYDKIATTAWNITFNKLESDAQSDPLSKAVVQLLSICSYCAPDDIPLRMFIDGREQLPSPLHEALFSKKLQNNSLIDKLTNLSIVSMRLKNDEVLLTIHRLFMAAINNNPFHNSQWLINCLNMAIAVFNYQYNDKQSFDNFSAILPHALEIAQHSESAFRRDEEMLEKAAKLYHGAGFGSDIIGDYDKSLEWYQKAGTIRKKVLGTEHPLTAATYHNIAVVYDSQGDYAKALEWNLKVLDIREKVLGTEHPSTAATYNNIAVVYDNQGDYAKALEWNHEALDIREKVLGTEHPSTATTYNNIAIVYKNQGNYAKALEWFNKVLAIKEKALGTEHPSTATTYNNIALVYSEQGDYTKALEWYQKALPIREKVLGMWHTETATTYSNIAVVFDKQSDYTKALEWYQKALAIREKVLGKEHPNTVTICKNIVRANEKSR